MVFVPRRFLLPLFVLAIWGFGVQTRFRWLGTTQAMFWVLWETGQGQAGGQLQGKAWLRQLRRELGGQWRPGRVSDLVLVFDDD